jgi:hypothetical protein
MTLDSGITRSAIQRQLDQGEWTSLSVRGPNVSQADGVVNALLMMWCQSVVAEDHIETQLLKYVGTLIRQNLLSIHHAFHAILLKHGMDQETLDEWSRFVDEGE